MNRGDQVHAVGIAEDFSCGDHVLLDGCGGHPVGAELLDEIAELGVANAGHSYLAEVGHVGLVQSVLKDAQARTAQFTPLYTGLLERQCRRHHICEQGFADLLLE